MYMIQQISLKCSPYKYQSYPGQNIDLRVPKFQILLSLKKLIGQLSQNNSKN